MDLEEKIKQQLVNRGFTKKKLLNNRGLIGATIDETVLQIFKNLGKINDSQENENENEKVKLQAKLIDRLKAEIQEKIILRDTDGETENIVNEIHEYLQSKIKVPKNIEIVKLKTGVSGRWSLGLVFDENKVLLYSKQLKSWFIYPYVDSDDFKSVNCKMIPCKNKEPGDLFFFCHNIENQKHELNRYRIYIGDDKYIGIFDGELFIQKYNTNQKMYRIIEDN